MGCFWGVYTMNDVERRVAVRRSEANTPRSEMEPNRRKLHDRRAVPFDYTVRQRARPLRDLTDNELMAIQRVSDARILDRALLVTFSPLGHLAEYELGEREYAASLGVTER